MAIGVKEGAITLIFKHLKAHFDLYQKQNKTKKNLFIDYNFGYKHGTRVKALKAPL